MDVQLYPRSERTAACVSPHNGDVGRVADAPFGSEVGEDEPDINTGRRKPCRETMAENTGRARFFVNSFEYVNVKALRRRYGAERADPPTPGVSGEGEANPNKETARKGGQRR